MEDTWEHVHYDRIALSVADQFRTVQPLITDTFFSTHCVGQRANR